MKKICKNCKYFVIREYYPKMVCWRYPKGETVGEDEWCGEFKAKGKKLKRDDIERKG